MDDDDIIYEETPNGLIYYIYSDDELIGFEYDGKTYYYEKNQQSDIIGILNDEFNEIATYTYDSWGKILSIKDSDGKEITNKNNIALINPFRYRSYYYDSETSLYYLNSRYYNPDMGRFINADGYISTDTGLLGYNMYAYSNNNPIVYGDSTGKGIISVLSAIVVATVYAYNSVAQYVKAQSQIKNVQKNKNVVDGTKKINAKMKKSAKDLQAKTKGMNIYNKLVTFKSVVDNDKKYDLKKQEGWNIPMKYNGIVLEPQDIGNLHYGYIGRSIGIPLDMLLLGAGYNQVTNKYRNYLWCMTPSACDDPRDTYYVRMGALIYDNESI